MGQDVMLRSGVGRANGPVENERSVTKRTGRPGLCISIPFYRPVGVVSLTIVRNDARSIKGDA